jgi:methanogenic corrinoid protein MtbC1
MNIIEQVSESEPRKEPQISETLDDLAKKYLQYLLSATREKASKLILDSVENGMDIRDIYLNVFQQSQIEIGRLWETNQISVAQEHYCTASTQLIMSRLFPYFSSDKRHDHKLLAICVGGELHEIGLRMVTDFFEMDGWDTYYVGANTPIESVIESLQSQHIDIIAISATITFNIPMVTELISTLRSSDVGDRIKILVGGRPFNIAPDLWMKVGADGYAPDALKAVDTAKQLLTNIPSKEESLHGTISLH